MNFRERILSKQIIYRSFKWLALPDGALEEVVAKNFFVPDGKRVLDLGCGVGDFAPYFAPRCDYVGIDFNESYIRVARSRHTGPGVTFIEADVRDPQVVARGPFDLIMMSGVLHHLPTADARSLIELIPPLLSPEGRFCAMEPVFAPDQSLTARLLLASDRGRYVRDEEGYVALFSSFSEVRASVLHGVLRFPYSHLVAEGRNPPP
jgi:ubiquinone/menaquinone biosynthesis C-methylase UbiE